MTMTLLLPLPLADIDKQSSPSLSSSQGFRCSTRVMEPSPAFQQPLTNIYSRAWKSNTLKERLNHSMAPTYFWDAVRNAKNSLYKSSHTDMRKIKHKSNDIAFKRLELAGVIQYNTSHPHIPKFIVKKTGSKRRTKPNNHGAVVKHTAKTYLHLERSKSTVVPIPAPADTPISVRAAVDRHAGKWEDRPTNRNTDTQLHTSHSSLKLNEYHQSLEKHRQHTGKSDKVSKEQQVVKKPFKDLKKHHHLSEDSSEVKKKPRALERREALSKPKQVIKKDDRCWCGGFKEPDFPDSDLRRIRIGSDLCPLPWLSEDDIQKMEFLAGGEVVSKASVPAHGQVLQVALDPPAHQKVQPSLKNSSNYGPSHRRPETHSERCQQGHCILIKRTDDWFEVFAFHLDRVLGLNRSLPALLRTFHSEILPYRYIRGSPRPVVWWDPDIQHLSDRNNDQNSVALSWVQYKELLKVHCGSEVDLRSAPCVGVEHTEWGRLAIFDFLLQVNDRLDRYCCGFMPEPTELCVENLLHTRCGKTKDLLLVHILVRKADPSRLVFIDNAGRPQQSQDNLNFRLLEGIDEFPEQAVSVLQSGCLESLLLRSLYSDRELWASRGGASGIRPLIHTVERRGKLLLQYIRNMKLQPERDL